MKVTQIIKWYRVEVAGGIVRVRLDQHPDRAKVSGEIEAPGGPPHWEFAGSVDAPSAWPVAGLRCRGSEPEDPFDPDAWRVSAVDRFSITRADKPVRWELDHRVVLIVEAAVARVRREARQ